MTLSVFFEVGSEHDDNCKMEFQFAQRQKSSKLMVPIVMEPRMRNTAEWGGPVGFALGSILYVDMAERDTGDIFALKKEIDLRLVEDGTSIGHDVHPSPEFPVASSVITTPPSASSQSSPERRGPTTADLEGKWCGICGPLPWVGACFSIKVSDHTSRCCGKLGLLSLRIIVHLIRVHPPPPSGRLRL